MQRRRCREVPTAERIRGKLLWRCAASASLVVALAVVPAGTAEAGSPVLPLPTTSRPVPVTSVPSSSGLVPTSSPARGGARGGAPSTSPSQVGSATTGLVPGGAPATTLPAVKGYVGGSDVSIADMWSGGDLQASTNLQIPITFGGLLVVFVLVQWLIDHRDPRFVEAPARKEDDSVGFD